MKVDNKVITNGPGAAQEKVLWIDFKDKAIDKLFIKSKNRITIKFNNIKVPYLTGLVLRYSPLTQKKKFYFLFQLRFSKKPFASILCNNL